MSWALEKNPLRSEGWTDCLQGLSKTCTIPERHDRIRCYIVWTRILTTPQRKRIPPSSGSKAAARDSHAELDLTGKKLTDEGFAAFVDDLIDCLEYRGENHPYGTVRLTELSLKGNALTTASMVKLGRVVALSGDTLIRLDLSDNEIQITNKTQRDEWAAFLESFQGCFMLKKIDFAGNKLGAAGFDVFARVYAKSDLDFVVLQGNLDAGDHENGISKDLDGIHLGGMLSFLESGSASSILVSLLTKRTRFENL